MNDTIADLKAFVSAQLSANCDPVLTKISTSHKMHLSVWTTRRRHKAIGVELDHRDRVNVWVVSMYAPPSPPASVVVAKKVWKGAAWQDKDPVSGQKERGANSNLKGYDEFRTKPITRLGIQSIDDARTIFEHLLA